MRKVPFDLGRWELLRLPAPRVKEHLSDAIVGHSPARAHASFEDRNLVSQAGLVPVMALAERCGLASVVRRDVRVAGRPG